MLKSRYPRVPVHVAVVALAISAIVSVCIGFQDAILISDDFHDIVRGAQLFWNHENLYRAWLNFRLNNGPNPELEPTYPPLMYILVRPLFALGWPLARGLVATLNVALAGTMIAALQKLYLPSLKPIYTFAMACLLWSSTPFRSLLLHGQIALLALCAFLFTAYFHRTKQTVLAVLFLSVAFVKYTVTLPLALIFLRHGGIRVLLGSAVIQVAIIVFASIWLGESPLRLLADMAGVNAHLMYQGYINYSNILWTFGDEWGRIGVLISVLISIATSVLMILRREGDELPAVALLAIVSSLVVYHTGYDMVLYAIPLTYVVGALGDKHSLTSSILTKASVAAVTATIVLLWFGIELVEAVAVPYFGTLTLGKHAFDSKHVLAVWFAVMISVTASLALLSTIVWRMSGPHASKAVS